MASPGKNKPSAPSIIKALLRFRTPRNVIRKVSRTYRNSVFCDLDPFIYTLAAHSSILKERDAQPLNIALPARVTGFEWTLAYSTQKHGASLHSLFRSLEKKAKDLPVLLLIEDLEGRTFGSYMSGAWTTNEHFSGDSSTFVFKGYPEEEFTAYKSTMKNSYFIQGGESFVAVGADKGRYALWLDDNLDRGRTDECDTFDSPKLVPHGDFRVKGLECWTIQ